MENKKYLHLFFIFLSMYVSAQTAGKIYLSSSATGRIYDVTGLPSLAAQTLPPVVSTPAYFNTSRGVDVSNISIGFDASADPANLPLVFLHSNIAPGSQIMKNGVNVGSTIPTGVNVTGLTTNNVPGNNFGQAFGISGKNLYRFYPAGTVTIPITPVDTSDTVWTAGSTFSNDSFYDYQNNIYTIVQNSTNTQRYLYKIFYNSTNNTAVATRVFLITGPVGTVNATANTSNASNIGNVRGLAYLFGQVYACSVNGNDQVNIYTINMANGSSVLARTYDVTGFTAGNLDMGSVEYYVPFKFNCTNIAFQGNSFVQGVSSQRTLRVAITDVVTPGTYTINVSGTDFTTLAYNATITTGQTFIDIPNVTYNGTGAAGSRTLTIDLNGSTTRCSVYTQIDTDSDNDGIGNISDLDADNDGILNSSEGLCVQSSVAATDGFDNPVVSILNANNLQSQNPYNGWTAADVNTGATLGPANIFNIIRVDGTPYNAGPDFAHSGNQYVDINGTARLYKEFTTTTNTVVSASAWFANRATADGGYPTTLPAAYSTWIEIFNVATNSVVVQGNTLQFNKSQGDEGWFESAVSNIALPPGTYRIRMYIDNYGHVDSISYCFSTDTDGDGIPDYLDKDSDNDGCADAIEGTELIRYNQIHSLSLPSNDPNYAVRGQIKVTANGSLAANQNAVVSKVAGANGVPEIVNPQASNTSGIAGIADNTDSPTPSSEVGQGIGTSRDRLVKDAECDRCFRPATSPGVGGIATNHGITALSTAGSGATEWPGKIKGAYTALNANTKGFVINRLTSAQINNITTAGTAVVGMMVYDTTANCLKIYDNSGSWKCFNNQSCDNFNN